MRWTSIVTAILGCFIFSHATHATAETRVALVIGNGAYRSTTPLPNPGNDGRDMSAALKAAGFDVVEAFDADKRALDAALRDFTDKLIKADVALFFYAGHGLQVGLQNYLIPIDAKLERERDLEFEAVRLDFVLRQMEIDREGKTSIVFLDACRDNPLSRNLARSMGTRSTAVGKGLAAATTGLGTFIAYSTQPGNVALDGDGRNSPFSSALVKHMGTKGRNLPATMIEVRKDVVAATGGRQVPWDHSALTGDFYFVPGASASSAPGQSANTGPSPDVAALQERLRRLEDDAKRREQQANVASAAKTSPPTAPTITPKSSGNSAANFQAPENARIEGLVVADQRQPNPEACRDWCDATPGCVAYQHGRRNPVMGQCRLFGRIDARLEDDQWRSATRASRDTVSNAAATLKLGTPSGRGQGFESYDGVGVMVGDQIKMGASDSVDGCRAVCRNTPGCKIAVYNDFFKGKNVACQIYGGVSTTIKMPSATMLVKSE